MSDTITLDADSLNRKHGFEDGDILGDALMTVYPGTIGEPKDLVAPKGWRGKFEHLVLYRLVRTHLVPLLPDQPRLFFMSTHHNPVRYTDYPDHQSYATTINSTVTLEDVAAAAHWVEAEWRAGRSGCPEETEI